jgi:ribosomal protein S18 acetylase RimI-like enzyme
MLSPDTELLRATVSDMNLARQAIADINLSSSHHRLALDDLALHEFLSDTRHYLIVAICDGKVLGSLYGYALRHPYRREPQFFIYGIDVRVQHQNRGVGTALVDRFISEARHEKAFEVWVLTNHTNLPAVAMYKRAGLKRCGDAEAMLELAL